MMVRWNGRDFEARIEDIEVEKPMILGNSKTVDEAVKQGRIALEKAIEEKALFRIGNKGCGTSTFRRFSALDRTESRSVDAGFRCRAASGKHTALRTSIARTAGP